MRALNDLEIGVTFWATRSPADDIRSVLAFGVQAGQLGIPGGLELTAVADAWTRAVVQHPGFAIATAVCAYAGEDYSDIARVRRTVGFTPPGTRRERIARTKRVSGFAARLAIGSLACHIGFIPDDRRDPVYQDVCAAVREVCDAAGEHGQTFALETGQERASVLLTFLRDVGRPNLKINFDPANLILYGMGNPTESLRVLSCHVVSIHCKDAVAPAAHTSGQLGTETRLGDGQVDFRAFLDTLRNAGYRGILSIERETSDVALRQADIRHAVLFLRQLLSVPSPTRDTAERI